MTISQTLPEVELASYLERHVEGFRGPLTATKFKGGQSNPTYRIDAASGVYVLRRKPPGALLASAHAVDREFRVISALRGTNVPVADALHLCTDDSVIGSMFYLMRFVDGRIFWDPALPQIDAPQRAAYFEEIIRVLARLHAIDVESAGLGDYGKPGNYFGRQVRRWTLSYRASATTPIAAMEALIDWLPAHCPLDDGRSMLVHGDFRIDNLIFHPTEARVVAIVDWELSTLGNGLSDLAYFCMALRLPRNPVIPGLAGMDRAALGIPDESALLAAYASHGSGAAVSDWNFCLAFNFFRLAAIAQGVAKRAQQGNASSEQADKTGQLTAVVAQLGADLIGPHQSLP